jgi:hypothetical protein
MVGTTRSRVNFFMKKFKKLGYIKSVCENSQCPGRRAPIAFVMGATEAWQ